MGFSVRCFLVVFTAVTLISPTLPRVSLNRTMVSSQERLSCFPLQAFFLIFRQQRKHATAFMLQIGEMI